ncbi:DUF192 domain-containing protein [Shimazuella sp. AN120528]|uniref:DUF192 domain-containing protein n=1 Tax=Shimazuella soli TaxID=1892854 RepID=UPI001F0F7C24|nr:DUF192 domain-containing protein [Shimazuella soli]MCH5586412.1 DUF192 domain-containing protein [Shimazuella soli]
MKKWIDVYRSHIFFRRAELALTEKELSKGLLGRNSAGSGLFLMGGRMVHTFQMKFPIDIVYLNQNGVIIALERNVTPNQYGGYYEEAAHIVEFDAGTIQVCQINIGEKWGWGRPIVGESQAISK